MNEYLLTSFSLPPNHFNWIKLTMRFGMSSASALHSYQSANALMPVLISSLHDLAAFAALSWASWDILQVAQTARGPHGPWDIILSTRPLSQRTHSVPFGLPARLTSSASFSWVLLGNTIDYSCQVAGIIVLCNCASWVAYHQDFCSSCVPSGHHWQMPCELKSSQR